MDSPISPAQIPHTSANRNDALEALIITNEQGIVLDWDSHAEAIFGWSQNEMIGQHLQQAIQRQDVLLIEQEFQRLTRTPKASERYYSAIGIHRSGQRISLEFSVQSLDLSSETARRYDFCLFVRNIDQFQDGYAELRRRERRFRILSYFSASVFGNDTIDEICWDITQNCIVELDFEDAIVYLLDGQRNVLVQSAAFGTGKEQNLSVINPLEIPLGQGIVGSAALSQSIEKIDNTTLDPRYIVDDKPRFSELSVPIVYKGVTLGVIDSEHSQKNFFTDDDVLILRQMASIAATKIVRIQAEEQVRLMNEHLEQRIAERTKDLQEANNEIQRQMEILAQQAQELEYSHVQLQEKNEQLSALNHELDNASRFKTEILSIVAHDLKNPLGAILNFAELSLYDTEPESSAFRHLQRISESAKYMFALTGKLLEAAAIDLGRIEIAPSVVGLAALVMNITELYYDRSTQKQQKILLETTPFIKVLGDEARLQQVIENLLSNAIKYSPFGTTIHIRVFTLAQSQRTPQHLNDCEYVRLEVQDEGPGFSNEDKRAAFQFFQRLSAQPTGGESSHGVGLALVKKIVDAHKGIIRLESEAGAGARFTVDLPSA